MAMHDEITRGWQPGAFSNETATSFPFEGICIGGPKDGERLAATAPKTMTYRDQFPMSLAPESYTRSLCLYTFRRVHCDGEIIGYWAPEYQGDLDTLKMVFSGYRPKDKG